MASAINYFTILATTVERALSCRPNDPLLPFVHEGLCTIINNPKKLPIITSKIPALSAT
jgi:hypothetical protein